MAAAAVISPAFFPALDTKPWSASNNDFSVSAPGQRHFPNSLHDSHDELDLHTYAQCWTLCDTSNAFAALARGLAIVVTAGQVAQIILRKTNSVSLPIPAEETEGQEEEIRDYTTTSELARICDQCSVSTLERLKEHGTQPTPSESRIALDSTHGLRQHGKKADKRAQKAAQRNKWLDSDDEGDGNKESGDGQGAGGGNGSGGDKAGGSGGGEDPNKGGNDQGDDDDDWNMGGRKQGRSKKKKAAAFSWDALDDEGDNKEDGDGADPAVAAVADAPAEANIEDEWKEFESVSKKKKRRGKTADPDPLPTPPVPDVKTADKKDPLGDIDLGTTKLDLNFDSNTGQGKKSSFGFSSWGGGWGASDSAWNFSGAGDAAAIKKDELKVDDPWASFGTGKSYKKQKDAVDTGFKAAAEETKQAEPEPVVEDDPWAAFTTSKSKKKKKGQVIDPAPEPPKEELPPPPPAMPEPAAESEPALEEAWGDWATMSSKDRKKARKAAKAAGKPDPSSNEAPETVPTPELSTKEEKPEDVVVGAIEEPKAEEDDLWTIGKKVKKGKGKKSGIVEVVETPPPEVTVQQPDKAPENPAEDDIWGWSTSKKVKSKVKGTVYDQSLPEAPDPPEDPIVLDTRNSKPSKDAKVDEDAFAAALGDDLDDLLVDEPAKPGKDKGSKTKSSKSSKDIDGKKSASDTGKLKSDGWSFWGSSLKSTPAPTKDATPVSEITPHHITSR